MSGGADCLESVSARGCKRSSASFPSFPPSATRGEALSHTQPSAGKGKSRLTYYVPFCSKEAGYGNTNGGVHVENQPVSAWTWSQRVRSQILSRARVYACVCACASPLFHARPTQQHDTRHDTHGLRVAHRPSAQVRPRGKMRSSPGVVVRHVSFVHVLLCALGE